MPSSVRKARWGAFTRVAYLLVLSSTITAQTQAQSGGKILTAADIQSWKSIRETALSPDGQWFAYAVHPNEGDGYVIIRRTQESKEYKFPVGSGGGSSLSISEDGKWAAFTVMPTFAETKQLRKQKKPVVAKTMLVNLSTGTSTVTYSDTRRFALSSSGNGWLAVHKSAPEGPAKNKFEGTDLIVRDLGTGQEINTGNVGEFAFDSTGRWLAWTVDAYEQAGNGVLVRDMTTGVVSPLDNEKAVYRKLVWTRGGIGLAVLRGAEDKTIGDTVASVVTFTGFASGKPARNVYQPASDASFPQQMVIALNGRVEPTPDLSTVYVSLRAAKNAKPDSTKAEDEKPDLVLWHWKDVRLQSLQQKNRATDERKLYAAAFHPSTAKLIRIENDTLEMPQLPTKDRYAILHNKHNYAMDGSLDGHQFVDLYVMDLNTGATKLALKRVGGYSSYGYPVSMSHDGSKFLYFTAGHYNVYDMQTGESRNITAKVPTSFINTEDDHPVKDPPIGAQGWAKDNARVILSDNWDIWSVAVDGSGGVNLTRNGKAEGIRYQQLHGYEPAPEGLDLSKPVYVRMYGEWTKKHGIGRIQPGTPGVSTILFEDARNDFVKAKNADVFIYTRQTSNVFPDYYVTDATMKPGSRLTDVNPQQKDFAWSSGARLIDYKNAKGVRLQGTMYLPANFDPNKKYPMVVYFYEKTSQNRHGYASPSTAQALNAAIYTNRGYIVYNPDIVYYTNDPGMSAVWAMVPAVKAAIATGNVDEKHVGITGHSWGGYQTAHLVTQTNLFAAAIAGAPLTNMVSMYSSIYSNVGITNQSIFESSQGRFGGGYWGPLREAYIRNSPVFHADKVNTPLMILHNDQDGAVHFNQGIEYYNTLRRLKKPVILLQYVGENHGLAKPANQKDYAARMLEWFDHFLMGKPAPKWLTDGIPSIKMDEHLKERAVTVPSAISSR
jgi:predicted peptidase